MASDYFHLLLTVYKISIEKLDKIYVFLQFQQFNSEFGKFNDKANYFNFESYNILLKLPLVKYSTKKPKKFLVHSKIS